MRQSKTVDRQVAGAGLSAAAVLLAAAMIPAGAADRGAHNRTDVALTAVASAADALDLTGLLQAEVSAGEGVFNSVIGFPGALIGDVVNPVETAISDVAALNYGEAFSAVAGIPVGLANTIIGLPVGLVEGIYNMILTLPGQYLLNFGAPDTTTSDSTTSDSTTSDSTTSDSTTSDSTTPGTTTSDPTDSGTSTSDGSSASAAAAPVDSIDPSDSGPHFLDFQGLLAADLGSFMQIFFGPAALYGSTANMIAVSDFLPAIEAAFHLDLTSTFQDLSAGAEGEAGLLSSTVTPILGDIAAIVALNPAYYLLDFDPFSLLPA